MLISDNPVERLYQILEKARSFPGNLPMSTVWARVFEIDSDDMKTLLVRISDLLVLIQTSKRCLEQLDVDRELYLSPFNRIERIFDNLSLSEPWSKHRKYIGDTTLRSLKFGADAVSRERNISDIGFVDEELKELQAKVENLLNEVLDASFPAEMKSVLVQKLEEIRSAILTYRVNGPEGLQKALENSLGTIVLYGGYIEEIQNEKPKRTFGKILEFMANIAQTLGFTLQVAQVAAPYVNMLGPRVE